MPSIKLKNAIMVILFALCLGAAVGLVLWLFLRAVSLGSALIWKYLPAQTGFPWIVIPVCALSGLAVGVLHKRFGDYPEELDAVMGKVKKDKHYSYHPMLVMLVCALIPLIIGASVGPEAGLTGIIAGLCYWIGDNVKFAKENAMFYSEIGEAVTLGQLFHMPLFGILAVEETPLAEGKDPIMPKAYKLVLYGLAAAASILSISALNLLFHTSIEAFPSFSEVFIAPADYVCMLLYIPVGLGLFYLFRATEKLAEAGAEHVPVIAREILCGIAVGILALWIPLVLFSGEEQMTELIADYSGYGPWFLMGASLVKVVITAFCLRFGLKGGHFFPLIFACTCMGIGLTLLVFPDAATHVAFASGIVTAAALGAQLKKPLTVSVLLLLCFPVQMLFWNLLTAALGGWIAQLVERDKQPTA